MPQCFKKDSTAHALIYFCMHEGVKFSYPVASLIYTWQKNGNVGLMELDLRDSTTNYISDLD